MARIVRLRLRFVSVRCSSAASPAARYAPEGENSDTASSGVSGLGWPSDTVNVKPKRCCSGLPSADWPDTSTYSG